jgi:hypothetical protein
MNNSQCTIIFWLQPLSINDKLEQLFFSKDEFCW